MSVEREDPRFTVALIHDVFEALKAHDYHRPIDPRAYDQATGATVSVLLELVRTFEGRRR